MPHLKKIKDIYAYNTHVSFEVFPPKTDQGLRKIYQSIAKLKQLNPDFFSVTYGADGSTAEKSLEIASAIINLAQTTCVAHFTCVGMNSDQVLDLLKSLKFHGVNNVLALRGDPPKGETNFTPPKGGFAHATELVSFIRKHSDVGVLVAGYPAGHTENPSKEDDFKHLVEKVKAGADGIVTQVVFENNYLYEFRDNLAKAGVEVPIACGIFPLSNAKQAKRITEMSGASIPKSLQQAIEKYIDQPEEMEKVGTEFAIYQVEDLLKNGMKDFHFYTMNRFQQTYNILFALKEYFPHLHFN